MGIQTVVDVASSALDAQSERIALIAQNLANADSVVSAGSGGGPYQRRMAVFESAPVAGGDGSEALGLKVAAMIRDPSAPRVVRDPGNPMADANGNVKEPAVDPVLEIIDLLEATRSYEANLSALETARTMTLKTIGILG